MLAPADTRTARQRTSGIAPRPRPGALPTAFGNALGQGLVDSMQPTQGEGPWSDKGYRNGSDLESDHADQDALAIRHNAAAMTAAMVSGEALAPTLANGRRLGMFSVDAGRVSANDRAALSALHDMGLSDESLAAIAPRMAWVADISGTSVDEAFSFGLNATQRTRMSSFDIVARQRWESYPTQLEAFDSAYVQNQDADGASQVATLSALRQYVVDVLPAQAAAAPAAEGSRLRDLHAAMVNGLLSYDSYYDSSITQLMPAGFSRLSAAQMPTGFDRSRLVDVRSGYFSALYRNTDSGAYILANRGTEGPEKLDIRANVLQAFGFESGQYTRAMENARALRSALGGQNLSFTGHSLGGGLASAQAMITGLPATTFNAAGLNAATIQRFDGAAYDANWSRAHRLIRAYYVDGDPLSRNQDSAVLQLGTAARGAEIARQMSRDPSLGISALNWSDRKLLLPMLDGSFSATEPNALPHAAGMRIMLQPTAEPVFTGNALGTGVQVPSGAGLHGMGNVMFGLFGQWPSR